MGFQAHADFPQWITPCKLPEEQMKEVIVTVEILGMPIPFIKPYEFIKLIARYKFDDLRENILTLIHNLDVLEQQD